MVKTVATVVFIAGVGAGALVMAQKRTTIKGTVMAADLLEQLDERGISEVHCDDAEVKNHGATFICRVAAKDGSRATIEYVMNREGAITGKQLGDTTQDVVPEREPRDPSADPWAQ